MELRLILDPDRSRDRKGQPGVGDERRGQARLGGGVGLGPDLVEPGLGLDIGEAG